MSLCACGSAPPPPPKRPDKPRIPTPTIAFAAQFGGGHSAPIRSIAVSPNGGIAASGGEDGLVRLWDLERGTEIKVLAKNQNPVRALAFEPGSRRLAVSDGDAVRLWDPDTGLEVRRFAGHRYAVNCLRYSADGATLVTGGADNRVLLWDAAGGTPRAEFPVGDFVASVDLSASILAAAVGDGSLRLLDLANGRELRRARIENRRICVVRFSPDGGTVFCGSVEGTIHAIDAKTGERIRTMEGHPGRVHALETTPTLLLSAGEDGTIRVWDPGDGTSKGILRGHTRAVLGLAVLPDGTTLLSSGRDLSVRVWSLPERREWYALTQHEKVPLGLAFDPSSAYLATCGEDGVIRIFEVPSGRGVLTLIGHRAAVFCLAFSRDGRTLATGDLEGKVFLWEWRIDGGGKAVVREQRTPFEGTGITAMAFSPEGTYLAAGSARGDLCLWDRSGRPKRAAGHPAAIRAIAFHPDGKALSTGAEDGSIRLWAMDGTPGALHREHAAAVTGLTFKEKTLVSCSLDKRVLLRRAGWGPLTHLAPITSMAMLPDGEHLLLGAADTTLQLWRLLPTEKHADFKAHEQAVVAVAAAPNGRWAASCSRDVSIKLWRLE